MSMCVGVVPLSAATMPCLDTVVVCVGCMLKAACQTILKLAYTLATAMILFCADVVQVQASPFLAYPFRD